MKIARALLVPSMALALGTLSATTVLADMDMEKTTTTTEKTTTYKGTVSEVNPSASTIILRSETSAPTTYTYNKETIFTDDGGKVVTYDAIKDSPVTVTYTRDGDRMIVTKVTKDPTVKRETTTTTTTH